MLEIVLIAAAGLLSWSLTGLLRRALGADGPTAAVTPRSLHVAPVARGGGLAILATVLLLWPLWSPAAFIGHGALVAGLGLLAVVSWLDDRRGLGVAVRLLVQALVIAIVLAGLDASRRLAPVLPLLAERALIALGWLWFVNLFNFMDGIDGLACVETIAVALGSVAVSALAATNGDLAAPALLLAAATAGFLYWNWAPARIFLGDTGSIPIGFLLGWMLLELAFSGLWAPALLLPLYFAADATWTLAARVSRREMPWQPHREHFYQRAALAGRTHAAVVRMVGGADLALIVAALIAVRIPWLGLAIGSAAVGRLLWALHAPRADSAS